MLKLIEEAKRYMALLYRLDFLISDAGRTDTLVTWNFIIVDITT